MEDRRRNPITSSSSSSSSKYRSEDRVSSPIFAPLRIPSCISPARQRVTCGEAVGGNQTGKGAEEGWRMN
ncbi:hypothetical protein E2C01_070605 [Portunus trituberculatus]|uniref:Uncharacterized protein n=1 Tax=Portunus trituberculatus TaxID=210409 RepID=A0A5B7I5Q1_PORTR|nr:hypothetical protein [Portunus trituberculatus]